MNELEEHIKEILRITIKYLRYIYPTEGKPFIDDGPRRLIFPPYSDEEKDGEFRVSEQELRFTFVDVFNGYCSDSENNVSNLRYSVETPTNGKYSFKNTDDPHIDDSGISGNMDLVIHDESGERLCLIEFKANNPEPKDIEKDLVKLTNCEECDRETGKPIPRYFIGMVKSSQPTVTKNSIKEKLDKIRVKPKEQRNREKVHILFFNLVGESILCEEFFEFQNLHSSNILNNWLEEVTNN